MCFLSAYAQILPLVQILHEIMPLRQLGGVICQKLVARKCGKKRHFGLNFSQNLPQIWDPGQ